jgi:hypothetical protein
MINNRHPASWILSIKEEFEAVASWRKAWGGAQAPWVFMKCFCPGPYCGTCGGCAFPLHLPITATDEGLVLGHGILGEWGKW